MLSVDADCEATVPVNRTWCAKTYIDNCSCQVRFYVSTFFCFLFFCSDEFFVQVVDMFDSQTGALLRQNLLPSLSKNATGTYGVTILRFQPLRKMQVCFQALWHCNPLTDSARTNTSDQKCYYTSHNQLDPEFYPPRCIYIHVKQNPQIISVVPLDILKILQTFTFSENGGTPPWRRKLTNSSIFLLVGELLELNVDAYDPNENDDVDIGFAADSKQPISSGLGLRQCCSDDFSLCAFRPYGYNQEIDVFTTSCTTNSNQEPGQAPLPAVVSTCKTTCVRQALPAPCRAGESIYPCCFLKKQKLYDPGLRSLCCPTQSRTSDSQDTPSGLTKQRLLDRLDCP